MPLSKDSCYVIAYNISGDCFPWSFMRWLLKHEACVRLETGNLICPRHVFASRIDVKDSQKNLYSCATYLDKPSNKRSMGELRNS